MTANIIQEAVSIRKLCLAEAFDIGYGLLLVVLFGHPGYLLRNHQVTHIGHAGTEKLQIFLIGIIVIVNIVKYMFQGCINLLQLLGRQLLCFRIGNNIRIFCRCVALLYRLDLLHILNHSLTEDSFPEQIRLLQFSLQYEGFFHSFLRNFLQRFLNKGQCRIIGNGNGGYCRSVVIDCLLRIILGAFGDIADSPVIIGDFQKGIVCAAIQRPVQQIRQFVAETAVLRLCMKNLIFIRILLNIQHQGGIIHAVLFKPALPAGGTDAPENLFPGLALKIGRILKHVVLFEQTEPAVSHGYHTNSYGQYQHHRANLIQNKGQGFPALRIFPSLHSYSFSTL